MLRAMNRRLLSATMLFAAAVVGCGRSDGLVLAPVAGIVLLDGQALSNAKVEFNPIEVQAVQKGKPVGGGSFAVTDKDGRFFLRFDSQRRGAVLGEHSVRITTAGQQTVADGQLPKPERVPLQYNLRSQLKFNVTQGTNAADFALSTTATARR